MYHTEIKIEGTFQQEKDGNLKFVEARIGIEGGDDPLGYKTNFDWLKGVVEKFKQGPEVTNEKRVQAKKESGRPDLNLRRALR